MLPEFSISLPHTIALMSYMLLLLYGLLKNYNWATYLGLGMITIDSLWNLNFSQQDITVHVATDLMLIGAISTIFLLIKRKRYKLSWLGFGLLAFVGTHIRQPISTNKIDKTLDSVDILLQFENNSVLNTWIAEHADTYNLTYPLFEPQDKSFLLDEYVGLSIDAEENITEVIDALSQLPELVHAERNDEVHVSDVLLNDPKLGKQWTSGQHELNKFHKLLSEQAKMAKMMASASSVIAILDTGIDATHEDLIDNYVSTARRFDTDVKGHGTHCAGIAAAVTGNGIGIASFLPPNSEIKVTSIKVLNNFGMGTQKSIIDGIIKAADIGCDVISLSLGGISSDKKEKAYNEAVKYAKAKGSIVVVAAGNSGDDATKYSPANSEGVIAVTATDTLMRRAAFGNDVAGLKMGLGAPGTEIYSTFPGDDYKAFNGSSMSAPFVSGLIGLMRAYDKELSADEAYKILKDSADKKAGLYIVNPLGALKLFFSNHLES